MGAMGRSLQPRVGYVTQMRKMLRCLYCLYERGKTCDKTNQNMGSHIYGCHSASLKRNGIYEYYKLTEGRDYIETGECIEFANKISPKSKDIQKQKASKSKNSATKIQDKINKLQSEKQVEYDEEVNELAGSSLLNELLKFDQSILNNDKDSNANLNIMNQKLHQQDLLIEHLMQQTKLIQNNRNAKELILKYIEKDLTPVEKCQKIKQVSRAEMNKIEFTLSGIDEQIDAIQEKYSKDFIQSQYLVEEFISKCLQFLVETVQKYLQYFNRLRYDKIQILENKLMRNQGMNFKQIDQEKRIQEQQRKYIHKQFVDSIQLQTQLKLHLNDLNQKLPSISIKGDVYSKNFLKNIGETQQELRGRKFDVLECDYPWPLDFSNKNGQKFLNYKTQTMKKLYELEIEDLQDNGYLFMWSIASKFTDAVAFMLYKGYRYVLLINFIVVQIVDTVAWIKRGIKANLTNRQGYHLRHNKEICLVGLKGSPPPGSKSFTASDTIIGTARKNSWKPVFIKHIIETLVPGGTYCEIFGRKNNLRDDWVTIGDEL
ncbi:MT-A70 family protein [Oxytricha trifallax]|uniref:mRNA m(6)A methyltransferase n=1 Tax=Oxytricha trifallax TaxID=1172189 RepID=A0A073HYY7_9SPIT|nr:MT-A70 family protein [Oxytricha trifallax]